MMHDYICVTSNSANNGDDVIWIANTNLVLIYHRNSSSSIRRPTPMSLPPPRFSLGILIYQEHKRNVMEACDIIRGWRSFRCHELQDLSSLIGMESSAWLAVRLEEFVVLLEHVIAESSDCYGAWG